MRLRIWIAGFFIGLCACVNADDEQVSVFAVTSPLAPEYSGVGLAFATHPLPRITVGSVLDVTELTGEPRVRFGIQSRALFSADLYTQWYPVLGVQYSSAFGGFNSNVGVGFQRRIGTGTRLFSEALWHSEPKHQQLRLGVRVWLLRLDSLDRRMLRAEPQGAVYRGGPVNDTAIDTLSIVTLSTGSSEPTHPEKGVAAIDPMSIDSSVSQLSTAVGLTALPEESEPLSKGWFVQLGVFRKATSVQRLKTDARLSDVQTMIRPWFDARLNAHRLLLGPMSEEDAEARQRQLKNAGLDSILYDNTQ